MSTQETAIADLATPGQPEPLSASEWSKLYRLGWKKPDLAEKLPSELRVMIAKREYKPGSEAYLKHKAVNPLTGTVGVDGLIGRFSDEEIAKRQANAAEPSGLEVIGNTEHDMMVRNPETGELENQTFVTELHDEWWKANASLLERGEGTVFDHAAKPYMKEFPGLSFRWLHPKIVSDIGDDGFVAFRDPKTKKLVERSGHYLAYRPIEVERELKQRGHEAVMRSLGAVDAGPRAAAKAAETQSFGQVKVGKGEYWADQKPDMPGAEIPGQYIRNIPSDNAA